MAQMVTWPALTDDDGSLTFGTVVNAAWEQAVKASIEDQCHNDTYPTVKPKDILGEVEAIKALKTVGSWTDLKDALDKVIDFTDASLIIPAAVIDQDTLQAALGAKNLAMNSTFLIWPKATQAAYWSADAQVSRDTTNKKIGQASMKLSRTGVDVYTSYQIIDDLAALMNGYFRGRKIGFGAWLKCSTGSAGKLSLYDGSTYTDKIAVGSAEFEWVSGTKILSGGATELTIRAGAINSDIDVNFDGITVWAIPQAPAVWVPNESVYKSLDLWFPGALGNGDNQGRYVFARPAMIKDVQCGTGVPGDGTGINPVGVLKIDIDKNDGGGWVSIFAAPKDIVDTAAYGSVQPDGTFINRCFLGGSGGPSTAQLADAVMRFNLNAVNGAEGFWFAVRYLQYVNPLEDFLAYDDL